MSENFTDARTSIAAVTTCPGPAAIAVIAVVGPWMESEQIREHLLSRRCHSCELALIQAWARRSPDPELIAQLGAYPQAGAFGAALRAHVEVRGAPRATTVTAMAPARAPEPALVENLRAAVGDWAERIVASL